MGDGGERVVTKDTEIIPAMAAAAKIMAGAGDMLGMFCLGFWAGVEAYAECRGDGERYINSENIGGGPNEQDKKVMAGGCSLFEHFNQAFSLSAFLDEKIKNREIERGLFTALVKRNCELAAKNEGKVN